jgi:hypothetical protein
MHRSTLYVGLLLILAMCLVPPFETGAVDRVGDVLRGETVQEVEYRPIWTRPAWREDDALAEVQDWNIAGGRLLLQILGVAAVTAVVAYLRGS